MDVMEGQLQRRDGQKFMVVRCSRYKSISDGATAREGRVYFLAFEQPWCKANRGFPQVALDSGFFGCGQCFDKFTKQLQRKTRDASYTHVYNIIICFNRKFVRIRAQFFAQGVT